MKIIPGLVIAPLLILCALFSLDSAVLAAKTSYDKNERETTQPKAKKQRIEDSSRITRQGAEAFVSDLGERAIKSLTQGDQVSIDTTFLQLLDEGFDLDYIARFVLGRYWKLFNEPQKTEFKTIFRQRLKNTYARRFKEYKDVVFKMKSSHAENGKENVETTIQKPGGPITPVQWEVVRNSSGYKIRDVVVEGISMGQTMRSEYYAAYQNSGGTPEKFLGSLK